MATALSKRVRKGMQGRKLRVNVEIKQDCGGRKGRDATPMDFEMNEIMEILYTCI